MAGEKQKYKHLKLGRACFNCPKPDCYGMCSLSWLTPEEVEMLDASGINETRKEQFTIRNHSRRK